jgi:hypothetical protein
VVQTPNQAGIMVATQPKEPAFAHRETLGLLVYWWYAL